MLNLIRKILTFIPVLIYDMLISRVLTIYSHLFLVDELKNTNPKLKETGSVLDIGIGTGMPLFKIHKEFGQNCKILGVDIDNNYVIAANNLFKNCKNVEIRYQNFYDIRSEKEGKFDYVMFTFSFMLMPDKQKALDLAKSLLKENGKIIFLLTLNNKRIKLVEKIKPIIKYLTSIDFGQVVYENEFKDLIKENKDIIVNKY